MTPDDYTNSAGDAYLAGLYEGEGSLTTSISNNRSFRLQLTLNMTDREPVDLFQQLAGFGSVVGPFRTPSMRKGGYKPQYRYSISGPEYVRQLFDRMSPWLSPRRRERFEQAFAEFDAYVETHGWTGTRNVWVGGKLVCQECRVMPLDVDEFTPDCRLCWARTRHRRQRRQRQERLAHNVDSPPMETLGSH